MNNQSPVWRAFTISMFALCKGQLDAPILIEVLDWDEKGAHDLIGRLQTTVNEMRIMKEANLTNPKRIGFSNNSGRLETILARDRKSVV